MKYYVYYIEDSSSFLKDFETKKAREKWIYEWLLKHHHHGCNNGYEIDFLFEGELTWKSGSYITQ